MATIQDNIEITPAACDASDGKLSGASAVRRGVRRTLRALGLECLDEVPLRNGRRADVMAIGPQSQIWIIEIKSSIADFRADQKWPEYWDFCNQLYFAVAPDFPLEILPARAGLILADAYGGDVMRHPEPSALAASRRKAITLAFARLAAARLQNLIDPAQML